MGQLRHFGKRRARVERFRRESARSFYLSYRLEMWLLTGIESINRGPNWLWQKKKQETPQIGQLVHDVWVGNTNLPLHSTTFLGGWA